MAKAGEGEVLGLGHFVFFKPGVRHFVWLSELGLSGLMTFRGLVCSLQVVLINTCSG